MKRLNRENIRIRLEVTAKLLRENFAEVKAGRGKEFNPLASTQNHKVTYEEAIDNIIETLETFAKSF